MSGWIGVDLDGTLAEYDEWRGIEHIGAPVGVMVNRVKDWHVHGKDVRIFTARVCHGDTGGARKYIEEWCATHLGFIPPVTCEKDYGMIELWDDRCVQIIPNTGARADAIDYVIG